MTREAPTHIQTLIELIRNEPTCLLLESWKQVSPCPRVERSDPTKKAEAVSDLRPFLFLRLDAHGLVEVDRADLVDPLLRTSILDESSDAVPDRV